MADPAGYATHEVLNQPGDLADYNAFSADGALMQAAERFAAGWAAPALTATGALIGSARLQSLARDANRHAPVWRSHDRFGHRIDEVEFHPAWHELMGLIRGSSYHALGWTAQRPGAQVARGIIAYLWSQGENGVCCPASMTFASLAALAHAPDLRATFQERILSLDYDPRPLPPHEKTSLGVAMAMTEKQGGSDLRQTQTTAQAQGDYFELTGHKWFFSVPTSDLFLTLARTDSGISCFLAQGWRDDGGRNHLQIQRLKDKAGNRSNASCEVEFRGLQARLVGAEGRGIATILEMAHLTRLECALSSAGLMRQAVAQAQHHASHRAAFQRRLIDQPIMRNVIADMALESEAAMWLSLRAAAALDGAERDPHEAALNRVITPVAKYWICKRAPMLVAEALECHGGNGFIEDHMMARLYREAPLNGVWEGAGNVICLDIIRALSRTPEAGRAVRTEIDQAAGFDPALDRLAASLAERIGQPHRLEQSARQFAEDLALALSASLLIRFAPAQIAQAYCRSRLGPARGAAFGTLDADTDFDAIVQRSYIG